MSDWNPERYQRNAAFVPELGRGVLDLLKPVPGEEILDLGCGDGVLTAELQNRGCRVIGVDTSPGMVAAARAKGVDARIMNGRHLEFESVFDGVFSNAALHWMQNLALVVEGVWRALKPGGRFVAEMGGAGNIASITQALKQGLASRGLRAPTPWVFPTQTELGELLQAAGFKIEFIADFSRPTPLPGDVGPWLETFARAYLDLLPQSARIDFIDELIERLRPQLVDGDGRWVADYVRLRFVAIKPDY